MQLSVLPLAALAGLASAQTVHVVSVGQDGASGALAYSPSNVTAKRGDVIQWQFKGAKHSVVMSNFDDPCNPIENFNKSIPGFYSGTMMSNGSTEAFGTFSVMVNSTDPIWVYCAVASHCANGMSMVINENTAANKTRSLANYRAASVNVKTVVPSEESGGTVGTSDGSSSSSSSSGSTGSGSTTGSGSSGTSSGSPSTSSGGSSTTSSSSKTPTGGANAALSVPSTFGLLAALGAVFAL